ncbi:N-acetylglucosamine-6-phosphate deacetylase [Pedobacter westerhofensis]|uniref:N-acetylglucosamine-6-phosphate deacetylase n=1 Tax=Pedobacter westerhofensis TaxID=425512 RepID=A0A521FKX2_9SPHI|nr:N-acetylglucosamine-6-phosphate deacetylase [Pedobacter westerhofensis]SMO96260.1 N-acetylglucosamine-6-phosphate deacetylase [Pedobacter westerhofensis]
MLKIFNGKIIAPGGLIDNGTVLIKDGIIQDILAGNPEIEGAEEIDAGGHYVSAGFIDLHVHGGGGHDFMDNTVEAFLGVAETHVKYGTTAMYPTTLSSTKQDILDTIATYQLALDQNTNGSQFLGLHLEGPYFAMAQRGAQDPKYIRDPDPEEYKEILADNKVVKRWSAAPELKGAIEFSRYLLSKNILPALAHTDAVYDEVLEGYQNGYTLATHLYSGMSGVTRRNAYRYAGVIESAFLIDGMSVEVIGDGIHLPAPLLQLIYKIKGADRIALITDAMRAAGMPPGESILGGLKNGLKVIVEDGVAKLPDRKSFAGSVTTADCLVRNMVNLAGVTLAEAVKMITETPAAIMGISDRKGSLVKGKDADLVIFNSNIGIQKTIIKGKVVYQSVYSSAKV